MPPMYWITCQYRLKFHQSHAILLALQLMLVPVDSAFVFPLLCGRLTLHQYSTEEKNIMIYLLQMHKCGKNCQLNMKYNNQVIRSYSPSCLTLISMYHKSDHIN